MQLHQDIASENVINDPEVCRICFGIVNKYLEGNSSKNKKYVTQLIELVLYSESVSMDIHH